MDFSINVFLTTNNFYVILVSIIDTSGGVMEKLIKILTDPVSNRIIQLIRINKHMTVSELLPQMQDIPRATVYRKTERMLKADVIEVVDTHRIRGQIENVYGLKNYFITAPQSGADGMKIMTLALIQIFELCSSYFRRDDADVNRDKLFVLNYVLSLSDSDFASMLSEIYAVVDKYQSKPITESSHIRNLYLMSMPSGGEQNEQEK